MQSKDTFKDLPVPRLRIGDKLFYGDVTQKRSTHPCPDCKGTRKWKVVTPEGSEFETDCLRCYGYQFDRIPPLAYSEWTPYVKEMTVGSIKIDTAEDRPGRRVSYMCEETGVGSGSVYGEDQAFATYDEAMIAATIRAQELNAKEATEPHRLEMERVSGVRLRDAVLDEARRATDRGGALARDLEEILQGEEGTTNYTPDDELREKIQDALDYHRRNRNG